MVSPVEVPVVVVIFYEPVSTFTMVDSAEIAVLVVSEDIQPEMVSISSIRPSLMAPKAKTALAPKPMFPASTDKARSLAMVRLPPAVGAPEMVRVLALSTNEPASVSVMVGA